MIALYQSAMSRACLAGSNLWRADKAAAVPRFSRRGLDSISRSSAEANAASSPIG